MGNVLVVSALQNETSHTLLIKLDPDGKLLWERTVNGTARGVGVAADANGNVYVGGDFFGTIDLGGGPLVSAAYRDQFLAKFSANGTHLWSRRFGGAVHDYINDIAVGPDGSVVMLGDFNGDVDFGGGVVSASWWTTVIAKYDDGGNYLWANTYTSGHQGSPSTKALDVAIDGFGNVAVAGSYWLTTNLGGADLSNAGAHDAFIAKYDAAGTHLWSMGFGGSDHDEAWGIALDGLDPLICGYFGGTVSFGGAALTATGSFDGFAARYDASGSHIWSRSFGSPDWDRARAMAVDASGSCLITGEVGGPASFGGPVLPAIGGADVFMALFDASGGHLWSTVYGGPGSDKGEGASCTHWGEYILTGRFETQGYFGGDTLVSIGGEDLFVAKYVSTATGIGATHIGPQRLSVFPNPFNPFTTIVYAIDRAGPATLQVYDVQGRVVATLVDGVHLDPGTYRARFEARVPSGVYWVRLVSLGRSESVKVVLLK